MARTTRKVTPEAVVSGYVEVEAPAEEVDPVRKVDGIRTGERSSHEHVDGLIRGGVEESGDDGRG